MVTTEPRLQPLSGEDIRGNRVDKARLDISAVGFWRPQDNVFFAMFVFSILIVNKNEEMSKEHANIYQLHENIKKSENT